MTEQTDWQPISTWFKEQDKTRPILVYFPAWGVEKVKAEFTGLTVFKFGDHAVASEAPPWNTKAGPTIPPTHWMPLPPPPQEG